MPPRKRTTTRRTSRRKTTRKTTKLNFNADLFNKVAGTFNSTIDNAIARQRRIDYLFDVGRSIGKTANWLMGRRFNTKTTMNKIKDMKYDLMKNNVKRTDPIFNNMKELKEKLRDIDFARKAGNGDMEDYNVMEAKRLLEKINKKYNKLMKD